MLIGSHIGANDWADSTAHWMKHVLQPLRVHLDKALVIVTPNITQDLSNVVVESNEVPILAQVGDNGGW